MGYTALMEMCTICEIKHGVNNASAWIASTTTAHYNHMIIWKLCCIHNC